MGNDALTMQIGFIGAALILLIFVFFNLRMADIQKKVDLLNLKHGSYVSEETEALQTKKKRNNDLIANYKKVAIFSNVVMFQRFIVESLPKGVWLKENVMSYVDTPHQESKQIPSRTTGDPSAVDKKTAVPANEDHDKLPRPTISLKGYAYFEDSNQRLKTINNYVTQLRGNEKFMGYFDEIKIISIESKTINDKTVSYFEISCN